MSRPTTLPIRAKNHAVVARGRAAGFTVTEIMVVLGIITLFYTTFAIATRPSPGKTLRVAQAEVSGLFAIARLQARATQGSGRKVGNDQDAARIIIYASKGTDADDTRYLRQIQVVVPDPDDPNNKWVTKSEIITLPVGVYFVPPGLPPVVEGVTWPSGTSRTSRFISMNSSSSQSSGSQQNSATNAVEMSVDGQTKKYFFIRMSARATVSGTGDRLVLSEGRQKDPADAGGEVVKFTNPQNLRGFLISQYGAVTFLNDAQDFPP